MICPPDSNDTALKQVRGKETVTSQQLDRIQTFGTNVSVNLNILPSSYMAMNPDPKSVMIEKEEQ